MNESAGSFKLTHYFQFNKIEADRFAVLGLRSSDLGSSWFLPLLLEVFDLNPSIKSLQRGGTLPVIVFAYERHAFSAVFAGFSNFNSNRRDR